MGRTDADRRLAERAAQPGRMRGIGLELDAAARAEPHRAGGILRAGLRRARALHSRERRFVADLLYDLIRYEGALNLAMESQQRLAHWLGALCDRGLDEATAEEVWRRDGRGHASFEATIPAGLLDLAALASVDHRTAERLEADLDDPEAFVRASNERAPVVVRVNPRRAARERVQEAFAAAGIEARPTARAPDGLVLEGRPHLPSLPAWREGWFEVQDEASQLVAGLVPPKGTVVDLCAGAGGKTLAIAAAGDARLVACDVRGRALDELRRRARRARARVEVRNLARGATLPVADAVLVDAPCTGTGVWRRHPELRWRAHQVDLRVEEQRCLLEQAAPAVRPGGALVFATCSVLAAEGSEQADWFESCHADFVREETLALTPHHDGTDGFYAVRWRRPQA